MRFSTIDSGFCFQADNGAEGGTAVVEKPAKAKPAKKAPKKAAKPAKKEKAPKDPNALGQNMLDSLQALAKGNELTHEEIAVKTKREKGNRLRELAELGLVRTNKYEGERGNKFCITAAGKKALEKSKK